MKCFKKGANGKICVLSGSSVGTRLVQYFRNNVGTIKIMTNELYSLRKVFGRSIGYDFTQYKIKIIINKDTIVDEDELKYMKTLMGDNFEYKLVEGVWTNCFIKDSSPIVNFDLYGFGYDPKLTHTLNKKYVKKGNRGMSFKLNSQELADEISNWFDLIWEKEEMTLFNSMKFLSRKPGKLTNYDGGGQCFSSTTVEISTTYTQEGINEIYDMGNIIMNDTQSNSITSKAKFFVYDKKITLVYNMESDMDLCLSFFDEDIVGYIYDTLRKMDYSKKGYSNDMDYLLNREEIFSHQLYAFLLLNVNNPIKIQMMKEHYLAIRPKDGPRKFRDTIENIERYCLVDLSMFK